MINLRSKKLFRLATMVLALLLSIGGAGSLFAATPHQSTTVDSATAIANSDGSLYAGPSPLYNEVGEFSEGDALTLVGQTPYRAWFQVESGEWVSMNLLTDMPPQLPDVPAPRSTASNSRTGDSPMASDAAMSDADMDDDADMGDAAMDDEAMDDDAMDDDAMDDDAMADDAMDEAAPEAMVTIPSGWTTIEDDERDYSLAVPSGWTELDLRGAQIATLANTFGQGAAVADLQTFLDTTEGQSVGVVAVTDLTNAFSGGLPTLLNVSVIGAPGATADGLLSYVEQVIELNSAMLGDIDIETLEATTTNNLPSVVGDATADLSNVGMNAQAAVKIAALIYEEQIYLITLGTQLGNRAAADPVFEQIIGTLKPE